MHSRFSRFIFLVVAALTVFGSGGFVIVQFEAVSAAESEHGIQMDDMDLSVSPGEDFYQFANGGWEDENEIPGTSATYGVTNEVIDKVNQELMDLVAELETDPATDSGKMKAFYEQFINEDERNENGIEPLQPILDRIQDIETIGDGLIFQESAQLDGIGLFDLSAFPALDDATTYIGWLQGPTYQLPSSSYYFDNSDETEEIRQAWIEATAGMLVILGYDEDEATDAAEQVLEFETDLLSNASPAAAYDDPSAYDNLLTIEQLEELLPDFDWSAWFDAIGVDSTEPVNVYDLNWLEGVADVLADAESDIFRNYYTVQLVWTNAAYVSLNIADLSFGFNAGTLLGITERRPIEERGILAAGDAFPDALGQIYVDEYFPPESKEAIEDLVANLISAFGERIRNAEWMSDETKDKALEKLDLMEVQVGYPESWKSYEEVELGATLFDTEHSATQLRIKEDLAKIGEPVNRSEWFASAFEVNAYYDSSANTIVFPAGILQAPYFDPLADPASNYGSIGAVIGHEITHGFDISGADYDGSGNAVNWWTDDDVAAFEDLNSLVVDQYDDVEVLPDLYVDGQYTIQENVADMGGVQVAYDALLVALGEDAELDEPWFLSQQQRFFIAFAASWRMMATPEYQENLILTDSHAPDIVRAVQPLRNMDQFFEAFDIVEGDDEYLPPEERIVIW